VFSHLDYKNVIIHYYFLHIKHVVSEVVSCVLKFRPPEFASMPLLEIRGFL